MTNGKREKRTLVSQRLTIDVSCAFCGGKGIDPFDIMSAMSACQVCSGRGSRRLRPPTASCAFCRGTGVHPGSRLTCTTCKGIGTVETPSDAVDCPDCNGMGHVVRHGVHGPDTLHSCTTCSGKGVVAPEAPQQRRLAA